MTVTGNARLALGARSLAIGLASALVLGDLGWTPTDFEPWGIGVSPFRRLMGLVWLFASAAAAMARSGWLA